MPFVIPAMPLLCRLYTAFDITMPPRVSDVPCNLAAGKRVFAPSTGGTGSTGVPLVSMQLLVPSTTDIRGRPSTTSLDVAEVPQGSGRYYFVESAEYVGLGFPNAHKVAVIWQRSPFKTPDV